MEFLIKYLPAVASGLVLVISSLTSAIVYLYLKNEKSKDSDVNKLRKEIEELKEINRNLLEEIALLQREKISVNSRFLAFLQSHDSCPLPMWIKDLNGRYLAVNEAYEKEYLLEKDLTIEKVLGKTDADVWPEHVANEFGDNDKKVLMYSVVMDTTETVPDGVDHKKQIRIIKYPVFSPGIKDPFAVAGIAIVDRIAGSV